MVPLRDCTCPFICSSSCARASWFQIGALTSRFLFAALLLSLRLAAASTFASLEPSASTPGKAVHTVTFDHYSLIVDGKRVFIYSGEFHPFRLPSPDLWRDIIEKMEADRFNTVCCYFDWGYHSPAPGVYDFSGVRNLDKFLDAAAEAGLYVIARPGPYINAETDSGGFPGWLTTIQGRARSTSPDYLANAQEWLSHIDPIIARHQLTNGTGTVIACPVPTSTPGPTPPVLSGTSATLSWNETSSDPVVSFNMYVGTTSGVYAAPINIGNVLTYTLMGLNPSTTYFVAVTALDAAGKESLKSNEVSFRTGAVSTSGITPSITLPANYKLAWNQDFTAPSYSPFNQASNVSAAGPPVSIWKAEVGNPGGMATQFNGEGDPFSTSSGYLTIHANGSGSPPYGGMISSSAKSYNVPKGTVLAGFHAANAYWEGKLLIPAGGSERWPCFWVIGSTAHVDPVTGQYAEVDITEITTSDQNLHLYTINADGTISNANPYHYSPPALSSGWHVWGCLIQPGSVSIYIDGVLSHQFTGLSGAWSVPMEVILDNSFGPGLPQSANPGWTNDLGVQYVRCWTPQ
jgi:hypothetical protein